MKIIYKYDDNGFFIGVENSFEDTVTPNSTEMPIPFNKNIRIPKWTGTEWVEGVTQEYLDILNNPQKPKTIEDALREQNAQLLLNVASLQQQNASILLQLAQIQAGGVS